jgi:membrane protein
VFGALRGSFSRFSAHDGLFLAAGLAFAFLVCLIPLVLIGVSLVGFILSSEQAAANEVVGQLTRNFPVYKGEITWILLRIVETRRASGLIGTTVLVLFSTSLFAATRLVLHRMLGVRAGGSLLRNLVVDAGMVLLLSVLLFGATAVTWGVQWFQEFVVEPTDPSGQWVPRVSLGFSLVLSTVMFYLAYRYVPQRRIRVGTALSGAVLASVLWEIAKQLFRLYIRRVGIYDQIYGPLSVLVAFVMFVYYTAVVFVFGAAWVAAMEARRH